MKKQIFTLLAATLFLLSGISYGQTVTTKMAAADEPTVANVLKWTKETLPKMELLVPKLEKIKADNTGKPHTDALKLLATVSQLKEINAKGTRLKAAEAQKYYDLVAATVNYFYIDCQQQGSGVCCVNCNPHGFLGIWCFANCFTIKPIPANN